MLFFSRSIREKSAYYRKATLYLSIRGLCRVTDKMIDYMKDDANKTKESRAGAGKHGAAKKGPIVQVSNSIRTQTDPITSKRLPIFRSNVSTAKVLLSFSR